MPMRHVNLFHPETRMLVSASPRDAQVALSPQEFTVLTTLNNSHHDFVPTGHITAALYENTGKVPVNAERTLRVVILNIRQKLAAVGSEYEIVSKYGKGYHIRKIEAVGHVEPVV